MYLSIDGNVFFNFERLGLIEILRDYFMEQIIYFLICGMNILDFIVIYILGFVSNCYFLEKFSDYDVEVCMLNVILLFVGKLKDVID